MGDGTRGFPRDVADVRMPYRRRHIDVVACLFMADVKQKNAPFSGRFSFQFRVILRLALGYNFTRGSVDEKGVYLSRSIDNAHVIIAGVFKKQANINFSCKPVFVCH